MTGAASQSVGQVEALAVAAVPPRLDMPGQEHPPRAERRWPQAAEDATPAAVGQHVLREHVLADSRGGGHDPFGLRVGPVIVPNAGEVVGIQGGKLFLAEQFYLAAVLQPKKVR
jgi:hypothetical protein